MRAVVVAACLLASPGLAAEITEGGNADLSCILSLEGPIAPGDAAKLAEAMTDRYDDSGYVLSRWGHDCDAPRLCLNSPGGDLMEAIRMSDLLTGGVGGYGASLGTAVPEGAICESACAVLFMAGGQQTESEAGRQPDRVLHVKGRLGFHVPFLNVPEFDYSKAQIEAAYAAATTTLSEVTARMGKLRFRESLLEVMLATPPDQMRYVETLGEAAEWNIQLAGVPLLTEPGARNLRTACLNAGAAYVPVFQFPSWSGRAAEYVDRSASAFDTWIGWPGLEGLDMMAEDRAEGQRRIFRTDAGTELGDLGCSGELDLQTGDMLVRVPEADSWVLPVPHWQMLPAAMPLSVLAKAGPEQLPATALLWDQYAVFESTCSVLQDGAVTESWHCRIDSRRLINAVLHPWVALRIRLSGTDAELAVVRIDGNWLVDEQPARRRDQGGICWSYANDSTGAFCIGDPVKSDAPVDWPF